MLTKSNVCLAKCIAYLDQCSFTVKAHLCHFGFDFAWLCGMQTQYISLLDSDALIWSVLTENVFLIWACNFTLSAQKCFLLLHVALFEILGVQCK